MRPFSDRNRLRHRGFTILEMLVVMAIILILAALIVAGSMRMAEAANRRTTWRTITKLDKTLHQHWTAVIGQAEVESIPTSVLTMAGGDSNRARVIYIKLRLRQEFPTSFAEALNTTATPSPLPPLPSFQAVLGGAPAATPEVQSATCLWLTLKQQRDGVAFNPDTELSAAEIGTLTPTLKYITDAWHGPVILYRWPTGNTYFNPGGQPQPGTNDAGDPTGLLSNPAWVNALGGQFSAVCHPVAPGVSYTLNNPVLASPGPDGVSGLDPATMAVTNVGATIDNYYSYLMSIGK